jgi:hypothetical protein
MPMDGRSKELAMFAVSPRGYTQDEWKTKNALTFLQTLATIPATPEASHFPDSSIFHARTASSIIAIRPPK